MPGSQRDRTPFGAPLHPLTLTWLPMSAEKADPSDVAKAIADAVAGTHDVTPDPASAALWQAWTAAQRSLDELFAGG